MALEPAIHDAVGNQHVAETADNNVNKPATEAVDLVNNQLYDKIGKQFAV